MHYDPKVVVRLKKVEGQLRAVMRMMEEGRDCKDVITQLSAVRSAVDRTMGVVMAGNLVKCIAESEDDSEHAELVKQAVDLLVKSR